MNCKECQSVLEEYFDGELQGDLAARVRLHLEECETCAAELSRISVEQNVFERYGAQLEVPKDLWTSIASRIESNPSLNERGPSSQQTWAMRLFAVPRLSVPVTAALIIAAVVLTAFVMRFVNSPERHSVATANTGNAPVVKHEPVQPAVTVNAEKSKAEVSGTSSTIASRPSQVIARRATRQESSPTKTAEHLVREAERKYLAAISILARDIDRNQSQIDPETRLKLDQALASIDRTIASTRKAVKQRPDDPIAAQYLLSAYARKVDALRELATSAF